jgi:hypothetical protein
MRYKETILQKTEASTTLIESVIKGIQAKMISPIDAINMLKDAKKRLDEAERLIEAE